MIDRVYVQALLGVYFFFVLVMYLFSCYARHIEELRDPPPEWSFAHRFARYCRLHPNFVRLLIAARISVTVISALCAVLFILSAAVSS